MNICFLVDQSSKAKNTFYLYNQLTSCLPEKADVLVVLGGDGFMLKCMRQYRQYQKPFYGIHCGTIGFLMNEKKEDVTSLIEALHNIKQSALNTLAFCATTADRREHKDYAINEIVFMRKTAVASKIRITIEKKERMLCYGDGVLLATPAGSTAYNASAGGTILPLDAHLLALTPLAVYKPRAWKGAVIKDQASFIFDVLEHQKRPVNLTYDNLMLKNIISLEAYSDIHQPIHLWFDASSPLEERILKEQFIS